MLCNSLEYFILNKFSLETIVICNDKFVILCKDVIIQKVKSYRQSGYDQIKNAAVEIEENLECSIGIPTETEIRGRKKKRQFDYEEAGKERRINLK